MIAYKTQLENCIHVSMIRIERLTLIKFPRKFLQNNLLPQGGAVVHSDFTIYKLSTTFYYEERVASFSFISSSFKMKCNSKNNGHFFISGSTGFPEKQGACIFTQEGTGIINSLWFPEQVICNVIFRLLNVCQRHMRKTLGLFSSLVI